MKVIELKYNGSVERIFIPLKEEQSSIEGYLLTVTSCRIRSNAWVNPTKYEYLTPCSFNVIAKIKIFKGGKSTWKFENEFNFENPFIDNDKNMLNMSFIHKLSVDKLGYEKYQNMFLDEEDIIYNRNICKYK